MDNQNRDIVLFGEPAGVYAAALRARQGPPSPVLARPWTAEEEADGRRVMPVPLRGAFSGSSRPARPQAGARRPAAGALARAPAFKSSFRAADST